MMQTTQKDIIIFKIIDSLMKYMDKQALLEVKLAFLLYCISKIPLCLCFGLQIQLVELASCRLLATSLLHVACVQTPLPLVKIGEGASVIHCH